MTTRRRGAIAVAAVAVASLGLLVSMARAGDVAIEMTLVTDEDALWNDMDAVHLGSADNRSPTRSRFVVEKGERLEAVIIECRGQCKERPCGMPFHPGCPETKTCQRSVYQVSVELANRHEASEWLRMDN